MPFKDPEQEKKYRREQMRQRRARVKAQESHADEGISTSQTTGSTSTRHDSGAASSPEPLSSPAQTKQAARPAASESTGAPAAGSRSDKPTANSRSAPKVKSPVRKSEKPESCDICGGRDFYYIDGSGWFCVKCYPLQPKAKSRPDPSALVQAQELAAITRKELDTRGWCLWKCANLDGDVVAIIKDESVTDYPQGYPVYTEDDLRNLPKTISPWALRMIHEAKKQALVQVLPGFERAFTGNSN